MGDLPIGAPHPAGARFAGYPGDQGLTGVGRVDARCHHLALLPVPLPHAFGATDEYRVTTRMGIVERQARRFNQRREGVIELCIRNGACGL